MVQNSTASMEATMKKIALLFFDNQTSLSIHPKSRLSYIAAQVDP